VLTDSPPRKTNRTGFLKSDRIKSLDLPQDGCLFAIAKSIESTLRTAKPIDLHRACAQFLDSASTFYNVPDSVIRVLAARVLRLRERGTFELFGDYAPETMLIRVWMRTAAPKEITSFGTFLSTLCHEFCHHLDFQKFGYPDSWHIRGFYEPAAVLYHHARGTPQKRLFGVSMAGGDGASTGRGRTRPHAGKSLEWQTI
jgi:hypothetical protein